MRLKAFIAGIFFFLQNAKDESSKFNRDFLWAGAPFVSLPNYIRSSSELWHCIFQEYSHISEIYELS